MVRVTAPPFLYKFWDPCLIFERLNLETSNLVQNDHDKCYPINEKLPYMGRGQSHVISFLNFGTSISVEWVMQRGASNLVYRLTI